MRSQVLFTPGPLNTTADVKGAMAVDLGSRTPALAELTEKVRESLLRVAECGSEYTCIPLQGSGTFAVEAMLTSIDYRCNKILILNNGVYSRRMVEIAGIHRLNFVPIEFDDHKPVDVARVESYLRNAPDITGIAMVHFETGLGVLNDISSIGKVATQFGCDVYLDAISTFGAQHIDFRSIPFASVVASSGKCLHGVPGMGFSIHRKDCISDTAPQRTLSLDLGQQYQYFERNGVWRFTPPVHVILALQKAIEQYWVEGGREGRISRYQEIDRIINDGLRSCHVTPLIPDEYSCPIIRTYVLPNECPINAALLADRLYEEGLVIYPSHLSDGRSFRVGAIGELTQSDVHRLVRSIYEKMI